jgi:hypothetical protein
MKLRRLSDRCKTGCNATHQKSYTDHQQYESNQASHSILLIRSWHDFHDTRLAGWALMQLRRRLMNNVTVNLDAANEKPPNAQVRGLIVFI